MVLDELLRPASGSTREPRRAAASIPRSSPRAGEGLLRTSVKTSTYTTSYRRAHRATRTSRPAPRSSMASSSSRGRTFSFWERSAPSGGARLRVCRRDHQQPIGRERDRRRTLPGLGPRSSTRFRARATTSLSARHGYYIDRYPIGYDAAVFEPGVDFKWRTTPEPGVHLVMVGRHLAHDRHVSIPTGRTVVISEASQRNFVHPARTSPPTPRSPKGVSWTARCLPNAHRLREWRDLPPKTSSEATTPPVWGGPVTPPSGRAEAVTAARDRLESARIRP